MKNSTLSLLLCILFSSFASLARTNQQNQQSQNNTITPFYTEDFASGVPAGWQRTDSSGSGIIWHYTTTGAFNGIDSLNPVGTTAANGYMIYDSDSAGSSVGGENADLISALISCVGHASVHLTFNEFLTHYNDTATVQISNNGSTWTEVFNASAGLSQFSSTQNANSVDIDISSVAANQDTVYIRFNYKADFSFFWMIDDIQLYEASSIDGALASITAPSNSCTLLTSTTPVSVNVFNNGGSAITSGFDVTFIGDNGTPVTEHITDTIAVGATYPYTFTGTVDFSAAGSHSVKSYITLTGDTNALNDTSNSTLFNGPHPVNTSNSYYIGFEASEDLSGLLPEDADNDGNTWNMSNIFPNNGTTCAQVAAPTANDWLFTTCLDLDSALVYKITYYYRTTSTSTQANFQVMIGQSPSSNGMTQEIVPFFPVTSLAYLPGIAQFNVAPSGTYYFGFHVTNTDSIVGFRLDDINITVDSGVGIAKINTSDVSVYPNPSSGVVYLTSNKTTVSGYTVEVMSSIGKLISTEKTGSLNHFSIDLNRQPSGIYLVRVISENGTYTHKISISR